MKSITVPATLDELDTVQEFIDGELEECGCGMRTQMQIDLAVEEIFVNIASYAYRPVTGEAEVRCQVEEDPLRVIIQFLDNGKPFDPLAKEDVDISEDGLVGREGGLGILMVKKSMDGVEYSYEDGKNVLTICKNLDED